MDLLDDSIDRRFMTEALRLAARIPRRPWPNPPVGAVVVCDGRVVGRGAHHGAGTEHAETSALREAGGRARGATLYCTLEPCNHHGRTPPCTPEVVAAGVARVVAAMRDTNPAVRGGGLRCLVEAGIDVRVGVMAAEALDLAWPFVATVAFQRPFVVLKTATSLDGCFAPPPGHRTTAAPFYLTGPEARRDVHRLRRWCDVVLVGEGTMAADRPQLDARLANDGDECPTEDPVPAYVDSDLSLGAGWTKAHWVFAGDAAAGGERGRAIEAAGGLPVACETVDGRVDPRSLVARFRERGGHVLLVEGGPTLAASFLRAGLVDRWISYVAPTVLGAGVRWADGADRLDYFATRADRVGSDVRAVFDRVCFDEALHAVTAVPGVP